jgi:membrane-associated phospholipid phosphatase
MRWRASPRRGATLLLLLLSVVAGAEPAAAQTLLAPPPQADGEEARPRPGPPAAPAPGDHLPPAAGRVELAARPAPRFESGHGWVVLGLTAGTAALTTVDLRLAERARAERVRGAAPLDLGARLFRFTGMPGSAVAAGALWVAGVAGDDPELALLGLHTGQAIVIAQAVTLTGKLAVGRARPRQSPHDPFDLAPGRGLVGGGFRSFPSAHTSAAFAASSALVTGMRHEHADLRVWAAPLLYGSATLAGVSRIYHDEHWASDIAAGALIGILSGRYTVEFQRRHSR